MLDGNEGKGEEGEDRSGMGKREDRVFLEKRDNDRGDGKKDRGKRGRIAIVWRDREKGKRKTEKERKDGRELGVRNIINGASG